MSLEGVPQSKERVGDWTVLEKFTAPKDLFTGVEDGLYIGKNIAFVCDGVTSQTRDTVDGFSPGRFAVHAAIEALKSPAGHDVDSHSVVSFLTRHVAESLEKARADGKEIPGHPSFVFIAFFPKENKLVRIRDCQYLIDGSGNNPGFIADIEKKEQYQKMISQREEELGRKFTPDEKEEYLKEIKAYGREWQWQFRNSEKPSKYRYAVIDGSEVPGDLVEVMDVPPDAKEIVLASDGYVDGTLAPTMKESHERYQKQLEATGKGGDFNIDDLTYLRLKKGA